MITRRQARILKRHTRKFYGRNYIPVVTPDNTLSIGDILESPRDLNALIDGAEFDENLTRYNEGNPINSNIVSSSSIDISLKVSGQNFLAEQFSIEEAGLAVKFNKENQMFLKVRGLRQQSMSNFIDFKNFMLAKYSEGTLASKCYIVRGLVYADQYYLQFSGSSGGEVAFDLDAQAPGNSADIEAQFSLKWKKSVGFFLDGQKGGVLAYRVSGIRLRRENIPENIQRQLLNGVSETAILDTISFSERQALVDSDIIDLVDITDETMTELNDIVL